MRTMSNPFKRSESDGTRIWHLGSLLTVKVTADDTGGAYSLVEYLAPQGPATPLHRHAGEDELFFVHDGDVTFVVDDEIIETHAGDFVHAAAGHQHALIVGSETARFSVITMPAGFEQFFVDTGEPAAGDELPPPMTGPPDVERLASEAARHGVTILGPPPDLGLPA